MYPVGDGGAAAAYPDEAVESVDGGELKAQTEEVKREDAENIHLIKEHSGQMQKQETFSVVCI